MALTPSQDRQLTYLVEHDDKLSDWEKKFVNDMVEKLGKKDSTLKMSSKQETKIDEIFKAIKSKVHDEESG